VTKLAVIKLHIKRFENMKKQAGFTLIELIMVIVILGILSAFALPRFADLSGSASSAAIDGAVGSVRSSSAIVRAACLAAPVATCDESAATSSITLEGQAIATAYGYPTTASISTAAQLNGFSTDTSVAGTVIIHNDANCLFFTQATSTSSGITVGGGGTATYDSTGANLAAKCS
jgi:MSHA pilin protein MshA